jgi:hypothetical protein
LIDMIFLNKECDPKIAKDKSLPNNAFLVEYISDGETCYDLVQSSKKVEIFDHYYDNYKSGLKNITQSDGAINPKLWNNPNKKEKK